MKPPIWSDGLELQYFLQNDYAPQSRAYSLGNTRALRYRRLPEVLLPVPVVRLMPNRSSAEDL